MKKWWGLGIGCGVAALLILIGVLQVHPNFFRATKLAANSDLRIWQPTHASSRALSQNPEVHQYRGSVDRRAVVQVPNFRFEFSSRWKSADVNVGIHGASKASVVSSLGSFFVGTDTSWFYKFNERGDVLWKAYLGDSNRGIHSTALILGDSVYIGSYRGTAYRLDQATGQVLWSRILGDTIGASPLLVLDKLVWNVETLQPNGYLIAVDPVSGQTIWQSPFLGEQSHSSPSYDPQSGIMVIGVNNSTLQGFDLRSGQRLWKLKLKGPMKSTVWIENGIAYGTSWGGEAFAVDIPRGRFIWRTPLAKNSMVSPALSQRDQVLLVSDHSGDVSGLSAQDGRVLWKNKATDSFVQLSSAVLLKSPHEDRFLFRCELKKMCLIKTNGKVEKTWPLAGIMSGSPLWTESAEIAVAYDEGPLEVFDVKWPK